MDLAFAGALAPGPRDRRLDGGQIRPEPFGKAPEGREGDPGSTSQPWFERGWRALTDQGSNVLCERHRLPQRGRWRGEPRQQLLVLLCTVVQHMED